MHPQGRTDLSAANLDALQALKLSSCLKCRIQIPNSSQEGVQPAKQGPALNLPWILWHLLLGCDPVKNSFPFTCYNGNWFETAIHWGRQASLFPGAAAFAWPSAPPGV